MQTRRIIFSLSVLLILCCLGCDSGGGDTHLQAPATNMSGSWEFEAWVTGNTSESFYGQMELVQDGNQITGNCSYSGYTIPVKGTISGTTLDLIFDFETAYGWQGSNSIVTGTLNPTNYDEVAGDWYDDEDSGQWRSRRVPGTSKTGTNDESILFKNCE